MGTIEQPINLVGHSDPASIPLGAVVYNANYNYGIHKLISAPRPCMHGAMEWRDGTELNQNLANIFGISVEPQDSTSVPYTPVNLRIKAWSKPAYSPYSKEQVLAATLHCLLRSTAATPKNPLNIKIIADNPDDLAWAKKYEKDYINRADHDGPQITPTAILGTILTTNKLGVTSVNFTNVKAQPSQLEPIMVASRMGGADGEDNTCVLIPVWVGTTWKSPLSAMVHRCGLYHDIFTHDSPISADANLLATQDDPPRASFHTDDNETSLSITIGEMSEQDLAASLYAAIVSVQPSIEKPLMVSIRQYADDFESLPSFVASKDWKEVAQQNTSSLECKFTIDPKTGKLTTGSIPRIEKTERSAGGAIRLINSSVE